MSFNASELRAVTQSNKVCIEIVEYLSSAYRMLAAENPSSTELFFVFFSNIVNLATYYAMCRVETDFGIVCNDVPKEPDKSFPYFVAEELANALTKEVIDRAKQAPIASHRFAEQRRLGSSAIAAMNALKLTSEVRVAIGPRQYSRPDLMQMTFQTRARLSPINHVKLHCEDFDRQWEPLTAIIETALDIAGAPLADRQLLSQMEKTYARRYCSNESRYNLRTDMLVIGSPANLGNRILALLACRKDIPVIVLTHGQWDGALDEPIFGYCEYGVADHIVGFGRALEGALTQARFLQNAPFRKGRPSVYGATAPDCFGKAAEAKPALPKVPWRSMRLLYVPTQYALDNFYGPFRNLPDKIYLDWQRELMSASGNIFIKPHPKSLVLARSFVEDSRIVMGDLQTAIKQFDGLIFDYASTASVTGTTSDKPILYFDFDGVRNMTGQAGNLLAARCDVVHVNDQSPKDFLDTALDQTPSSFNYDIVLQYSVAQQRRSQKEAMFQVFRDHRLGKA